MDLEALRRKMENCPCGVKHECELKALEVAHGNLGKTGDILKKYAFPTHILMVADKNSFTVTSGLAENLLAGGFSVQMRVYDDTKVATMEAVNEINAGGGLIRESVVPPKVKMMSYKLIGELLKKLNAA